MVNPDFDWDQFEDPESFSENSLEPVKEFQSDVSSTMDEIEHPEQESFQWGDYQDTETYQGEPDPTQDEHTLGYILRNISANASRLGEQFFGRYGNVEKMGKDILTNFPISGGVIGWALSELMGPEKWETMVKGQKGRQQMLPTSEDIKELSNELTSGYTKPKTKGEEKFQGYIEDIGSTITGRTLSNPNARNIALNSLLTPVAANATKDIVSGLGFGDTKANIAKTFVWLPLSLAFNVNASKFAANLMNEGRKGFNQNVQANVVRYQNRMNDISKNMLLGDPRSSLAQQQLTGINNDIANGQTSIRDLMTRYDALNAAKRDRGLFSLSPGDRKSAIRYIDMVRDGIREEIQQIGQANPQALRSWENGVLAFSTIHRSNALRNWIQGIAKGPYAKILSGPAAALFGLGSYTGLKAPIISAPSSLALHSAYKTGQTIYRMWNDKNLQKYYFYAILEAQRENAPAFINNYNKVNKELEKSKVVKKNSKTNK